MPETRDERADRLAAVAVELVTRVRDDNPDSNWRWFLSALPDPTDREAIAFVLAAAVPPDVPWTHLIRWASLRIDGFRIPPWESKDEYRADLIDPALAIGEVA